MPKLLSDEEVTAIQKATKLSEDINCSVQDIMNATKRPYRWLITYGVVLSVAKSVEYLLQKGIEMPADTIRSYTVFNKDGSPNRLEQALLQREIDRKVHRRAVGSIPRGVRLFTHAEVDLLGSL